MYVLYLIMFLLCCCLLGPLYISLISVGMCSNADHEILW